MKKYIILLPIILISLTIYGQKNKDIKTNNIILGIQYNAFTDRIDGKHKLRSKLFLTVSKMLNKNVIIGVKVGNYNTYYDFESLEKNFYIDSTYISRIDGYTKTNYTQFSIQSKYFFNVQKHNAPFGSFINLDLGVIHGKIDYIKATAIGQYRTPHLFIPTAYIYHNDSISMANNVINFTDILLNFGYGYSLKLSNSFLIEIGFNMGIPILSAIEEIRLFPTNSYKNEIRRFELLSIKQAHFLDYNVGLKYLF